MFLEKSHIFFFLYKKQHIRPNDEWESKVHDAVTASASSRDA